jgi:hypothetical protein
MSKPRDRSVDRRVAALFATRARQEAVKLNRLGDFRQAVLELREVADKIAGYAGSDPELRTIAALLWDEEEHWASTRHESLRKVAFASASYSLRSRGPEGKADR